jgi:carbon monoxide dehydrogenase subunit G
MKELHTEIDISTPAEHVWHLLTDFASYPQCNPFIRQISGELATGVPRGSHRASRRAGHDL